MRTPMHHRLSLIRRVLPLLALLGGTGLAAQQQFQGVCARVRIVIEQELTIERIGFEATLEVTNNDGADPLTEFMAELTFADPSHDPAAPEYDAAGKFFVQPPVFENINRIDGQGIIGPTRKAVVRWFIIPKTGTGGTDPRGKVYSVGCRLSANIRGAPVPPEALLVIADDITVKPEPELEIRYFQPRDVQGDDPFTPKVESPIPFTLGVLVSNAGWGPARKVTIKSQQPRIVENKQGLLLVARLLGARVMDSPLDEASLTVNLGDIPPQQTRKGAWDMITSLSGEFIEFKASYTHAAELGGEETSLIRLLEAHFIAAEVLNDEPGRDRIRDFLADVDRDPEMLPDTLFESDGTILPVNHLQRVTVNPFTGPLSFTVDLEADFAGWGYMRMEDPGQANLQIASVTRSDGKTLNRHNYWTHVRYRPSDNKRLAFLNLFDRVENGTNYTYTVTYRAPAQDTTPPVTRLRFAGEVTERDGRFYVTRDTQLYFTAEDESPVSIVYRLDDGDFRPALPFTLRVPGTYLLQYRATDAAGNTEPVKSAILVLPEGGPLLTGLAVEQATLYLAGSALSVRPRAASLSLQVGPSDLPVTAQVAVYRGVRVHPVLRGMPFSPTPRADLDLEVGGELVDYYKYRINGGAWSGERSVADPLPVRGASGAVTVQVLGRSRHGAYPPPEEAVGVQWVVDPAAIDWQVSGLPSHVSAATSLALTVGGSGFALYRWTIDGGYYRAEAAPGTGFTLAGLAQGPHTLALIAPEPGGGWNEQAVGATFTWTVDAAYGSDMGDLPVVLSRTFPDAQGSTIPFTWDGLDGQARLLPPGWYTVLVRLTDSLGAVTHAKQLLHIEQLAGAGRTVATADSGPAMPHARGRWLVWQESGSGAANIRARRLDAAGQPLRVTDSARSQELPRTDGRHVVWQGRGENGNWDVYLADLDNPLVIQRITATDSLHETAPVIDWPWVVFQRRPVDGSAPWQLQAVNLATAETFPVYPGAGDQVGPALQAGRVVWQDFRDPGFGEIYFQDLESGTTLRLTEDTFGQYHPRIDGPWVVWQDNRHGQVEIYGYHLLRGASERLTLGPGNKARPFLAGGWLLFEEDTLGLESANFQLLDLATRRALPLTRSGEPKDSGCIAGNRLVWRQAGAAGPVLLEADLPALQAVFNEHNAVVVTAGMAENYGNAFSLLADWARAAGVERITRYTGSVPDWREESAYLQGGAPQGVNFALEAGQFLWVRFPAGEVLDLGPSRTDTLDLPAGISALSHDRFPLGYSAAALIRDLGAGRVQAVRMLDAATGFWRAIEVAADGRLIGANFPVPPVAVLLIHLKEPVAGWQPCTP